MEDGTTVEDEIVVADAHPRGARPFGPTAYVDKFRRLAEGTIRARRAATASSISLERLPTLTPDEVRECTFACPDLEAKTPTGGLF